MSKNEKKPKWEMLYEKYKNGEMDKRIEELKEKQGNEKYENKDGKDYVVSRDFSIEEYNELKRLEKIKSNIDKVTNVIEYRDMLQNKKEEIAEEIQRINELEQASDLTQKIEMDLVDLQNQRDLLLKERSTIEPEKRSEIDNKIKEIQNKISNNNIQFAEAQEKLKNRQNDKSRKFAGKSKDDLEKMSFEYSTKISKCNMVGNNLMKGASWNSIEVKLDNWKDRKFTSKEKITNKVPETTKIVPPPVPTKKVQAPIIDVDDIKPSENESKKIEESLTEVSEFDKKHPRLAKIRNWFREIFAREEDEEEIEEKAEEKVEEKTEEVKENKTNDFKEYLKQVAEKGYKQVNREKLDKAREEAIKRENEKFNKLNEEKREQNQTER